MWGVWGGWSTPPKAPTSRSKNAHNRSENKNYAIEGLHALPGEDQQYIFRPTALKFYAVRSFDA